MTVIDLNNYQSQGNIAFDMVAGCIIHQRKQGRTPDLITLNQIYYALLSAWVRKNYSAHKARANFYMDGVRIECDKLQSEQLKYFYLQKV